MGIRFRCHHCEHELHVKDFQGGKRGRCPECQGRFRVPASDAEHSLALEEDVTLVSPAKERENTQRAHAAQTSPASRTTSSKLAKPRQPTSREQPENAPSVRSDDAERESESSPELGQVAAPPPNQIAVLPRAVTDFPNAIWHVRPSAGGQYGPAPADVFTQWLIEGRVDQHAWVWRDDWQDWQ